MESNRKRKVKQYRDMKVIKTHLVSLRSYGSGVVGSVAAARAAACTRVV